MPARARWTAALKVLPDALGSCLSAFCPANALNRRIYKLRLKVKARSSWGCCFICDHWPRQARLVKDGEPAEIIHFLVLHEGARMMTILDIRDPFPWPIRTKLRICPIR